MTSVNIINNTQPVDPDFIIPELIKDLQAYLSDPSVENAQKLLDLLTKSGGEANVDAALKALGYSFQPGDKDPSSEVQGLIRLLQFIVKNPSDHQWAVEASYGEIDQIARWAGYNEIVDPRTGKFTLEFDDPAVMDQDIISLLKKFEQDPNDPNVLAHLNWIFTTVGYERVLAAFSKDPKIQQLIQTARSILADIENPSSGTSRESDITLLKSIINDILQGKAS